MCILQKNLFVNKTYTDQGVNQELAHSSSSEFLMGKIILMANNNKEPERAQR